MIRRPPRSTPLYSSAASDVYKRQASQVVFIDGIPSKQHYRKYKIKDPNVFIGHSDDFASIYEVIHRRFKKWSRFKENGGDFSILNDKTNSKLDNELLSDWPDLIMIDGGKGQLNAAIKALKELNLEEEVTTVSYTHLTLPTNREV